MVRFVVISLAVLFWSTGLFGQAPPIVYQLDLGNIRHHEITVQIDFPALAPGVLEVHMPQSSPGRYAVHNFAKNVFAVQAFDAEGKALAVSQKDINAWQVAGHQGFVRFQYRLFGNRADGTYAGIDNRKVHLNMPASFAYGVGLDQRPVELWVDLRDHLGWSVATQLEPLGNNRFRAPDYYYFYDSPTIIGDISRRSWTVKNPDGKTQTIEAALMHTGTEAEFDRYAGWMQRVVAEEQAVFGELPAFDYGHYTFLLSYNPWASGDGMEHRNSTVCSSTGSLARSDSALIGTVAHEFFHAWNVERLRPRSLEPFDFDRANMSGELWFAEGFTSYYTTLILCRAGIMTPEKYISGLSRTVNATLFGPGRKYRSPVQMSYHAPFVDAAASIDETNYQNTFISYYTYGAMIGLTLDLSLRTKFNGLGLDDYFRYLWVNYGKPEIPYQLADLELALAAVTKDPLFAHDFFSQYIYGHELPDMNALFAEMGIAMKANEATDLVDLRLRVTDEGLQVNTGLTEGQTLYKAGMNRGDVLTSCNGKALKTLEDWEALKNNLQSGQEIIITFLQNGKAEEGRTTIQRNPEVTLQLQESTGGNRPNRQIRQRRDAWLASQAQ